MLYYFTVHKLVVIVQIEYPSIYIMIDLDKFVQSIFIMYSIKKFDGNITIQNNEIL